MSNPNDFWSTLATGHTNTVLAGAMDSHLSGKSIGESFGDVSRLTDNYRAAGALVLPVEAGTKVVFAGNLGAHLTYDDVPADGITGEVVTVKSATGEITHHGGKVFVKWADGKFRPIHAEHLRLASTGKTAAVSRKKMESAIAGKMPPGSKKGRGSNRVIMLTGDSAKVIGKDNYSRHKMSEMPEDEITALYNFLVLGKRASTKQPWSYMSPGERRRAAKYWTKELKEARDLWYAEDRIPEIMESAARDGLVLKGEAFVPVKFDPSKHEVITRKRASVIRVASLGDLTQFLKRANGKLVHKSTNDLWSYSKDADGNFLVERLFDDDGEPLKG